LITRISFGCSVIFVSNVCRTIASPVGTYLMATSCVVSSGLWMTMSLSQKLPNAPGVGDAGQHEFLFE